jgi:geranylgeranyl diphosphate synthase type II
VAPAFEEDLRERQRLLEDFLSSCLESFAMPAGLREAMNYSLLAGGKRLRPALCLSCAALFGLEADYVLPFAAALECIHSYSLIHDDLPAMDDDDLRRGKPSSHKQFGEATAILAGDALLTDAFALMASAGLSGATRPVPAERTLGALRAVALAAGSSGMAGGQYLDMIYTARKDVTLEEIRKMQAAKTGALIAASCVSGALLAGAGAGDCGRIDAYGRSLGLAFQIVDDILNETGDEAVLGKPVGSDAEKGKLTWPALLGLEKSRELAAAAGREAVKALEAFSGAEADFLRRLVEYVLKRDS